MVIGRPTSLRGPVTTAAGDYFHPSMVPLLTWSPLLCEKSVDVICFAKSFKEGDKIQEFCVWQVIKPGNYGDLKNMRGNTRWCETFNVNIKRRGGEDKKKIKVSVLHCWDERCMRPASCQWWWPCSGLCLNGSGLWHSSLCERHMTPWRDGSWRPPICPTGLTQDQRTAEAAKTTGSI